MAALATWGIYIIFLSSIGSIINSAAILKEFSDVPWISLITIIVISVMAFWWTTQLLTGHGDELSSTVAKDKVCNLQAKYILFELKKEPGKKLSINNLYPKSVEFVLDQAKFLGEVSKLFFGLEQNIGGDMIEEMVRNLFPDRKEAIQFLLKNDEAENILFYLTDNEQSSPVRMDDLPHIDFFISYEVKEYSFLSKVYRKITNPF